MQLSGERVYAFWEQIKDLDATEPTARTTEFGIAVQIAEWFIRNARNFKMESFTLPRAREGLVSP